MNKTVLFIFNNTICFSFQPKRKIFQSESKDIFFLRAEKGIMEWDVDSGKLKILSGKNIWWHYTPPPPHSHSPSWPQWKQALALHGSLLLPCPFWRKIQLGGVASTLLASVGASVWVVSVAASYPTLSLFLLLTKQAELV